MKRLLLAAAALLLVACNGEPTTGLIGPLREVTVVTSYWDRIDSTLVPMLQRPVPTPQPEPEFKVRFGDPEKFETFSKFRIILLVGVPGDSLFRLILGPRGDTLVPGDFNLLKVPNPWLKGQFALILVCRDTSLLKPAIETYAARIRMTLREIVLEQLARATYYDGVDREKSREVGQLGDFTIDVPKRWLVNSDGAGSGFMYINAHYPDRVVFIYWQDAERALDPVALSALRDSLTGQFYDGDSINPIFTSADTVTFLSRPCIRLAGVWQNERATVGGPFVSYAFNHQGRFYLLDGIVYKPGKQKLNDMGQVEAVLRTFTPR